MDPANQPEAPKTTGKKQVKLSTGETVHIKPFCSRLIHKKYQDLMYGENDKPRMGDVNVACDYLVSELVEEDLDLDKLTVPDFDKILKECVKLVKTDDSKNV